jgi:hypothetical protein
VLANAGISFGEGRILRMKQNLKVPMELRRKIDECVAMAQAATNNKLRARHYATAQAYLQLYPAEATAEDTNQAVPTRQVRRDGDCTTIGDRAP